MIRTIRAFTLLCCSYCIFVVPPCRLLLGLTVISGVAIAQNAVPLINEPLVPDAVAPGGTGFTLTVNGTGFVSGSVVHWNNNALATKFVSGSRLTASVPASEIARRGTASVTVLNPGPGGGISNVDYFVINTPNTYFSVASSLVGSNEVTERPVLADLNGDGKLDLVGEPGGTADAITVRLGNGDGTFQPEILYPTAAGPNYPVVADFNGDGKLDIAILCESGVVSVLLGNGDGTFQAHVDSPVDAGLHNFSMAAGDFNRDGELDLVVGYQDPTNSAVSVLIGNGDGTFQAPVDYPAGLEPGSVAVADLNRDGKLDIVAANFGNFGGNTVSVLLGNGDGTFRPQVQYVTSGGPLSVIVADFNRDGILDLAVDCSCGFATRCGYPGEISILLGKGDGTFKSHVDYPADAFPYSVIAGDLTSNGVLDLAVPDLDYSEVSILLGKGNATFGAATTFSTSNRAVGVVVGDLNGDGALDLVVGTDAGFTIFLQNGIVSLSPSSLNFGPHLTASSTTENVTLTNVGSATLNISSMAITGDPDFTQKHTCGSSLAPKGHCTVSVSFTPTHLGPATATLTVTDNAPGSPQSVSLSGIGVTSGPNTTLSPTSLTFATQLVNTTSPAQPVTLANYGTQTLLISGVSIGGDFAQTHTCGASLASGASCTIAVTFKPGGRGDFAGKLSIADDTPGSPQTVSLSGTGTVVELNPPSLSFGIVRVGYSTSRTSTLTNIGKVLVNITGISITGGTTFTQTHTCGPTVGPGESCTITVTFKPASAGGKSADVSISDDAGGSPQLVPLAGVGEFCFVYRGHLKCKTAATAARTEVKSALTLRPIVPAPRVAGPSAVGTRTLHLVDASRPDPFKSDGSRRELLVRFWYPAQLLTECARASYASLRVWSYFSQLTGLPLPEVTTNSCQDAPVADGAHAVVIFTPGYTGTFTDHTFLFEDLASRGYVVASVDHTYEATAVEFPDGRLIKSAVGSHFDNTWRLDAPTLTRVLSTRRADLEFVLNELSRLNASSDSPFSGRLDISHIGLMGHSLGGEAAISALQHDHRFKAGVLLEGAITDESVKRTDAPVLMLATEREHWNENECGLWSNLMGPRSAVNLKGGEHLTPSDMVWLAKYGIKTGTMGPDRTMAAIRNYVAAFFDANLREWPMDPLLTGPSPDYADAAITTQDEQLCRQPESEPGK